MKTVIKVFAGSVGVACYVAVFYWLMDRAVFAPVEANPYHPVYSAVKIVEWALWICAGGTAWVCGFMWDMNR